MNSKANNRDSIIIRTSIIGIIANVFLAGFKAFVGMASHSVAIVMDAVNNLSDALSSLITIIGTKLAGRAPDKKHPLGHGRTEYLSAAVISVIILYAGYSESMSGNSADCIWPKSGTVAGGNYDGKTVSRYAVSAELNGFPGCWSSAPWQRINGIGTLCHEFCHTMGMPDFYPTGKQGQSVKGNNQAMEYWSLMDSGNYLINGYEPVALTAWEREAFEWIEIPNLTDDQDLELKSIDDGGSAYRILNDNDNSGHEYFIIENIQNIGHNSAQKGHGMLVYHIDYDPNLFSMSYNKVNNTKGHPRMTIVPADNLLFAQYNVGKTIDGVYINNKYFYDELAGDPFPGTSHVTALNDTTNHVNFKVFNGATLNKAFDEITEHSSGIVSLKFISNFTDHLNGIHELQGSAINDDKHVYTLDGRRVNNPAILPKGIYIRNGKKVVIKD